MKSFIKSITAKITGDESRYKLNRNVRLEINDQESDLFFLNHFYLMGDTLIFNRDLTIQEDLSVKNPLKIEKTFMTSISKIKVLKIYIQNDSNKEYLWFVLQKLISTNCPNLKKLCIYQYGFDVPDEDMFLLVSSFLLQNPQIEIVKTQAKSDDIFELDKQEINNDEQEDNYNNKEQLGEEKKKDEVIEENKAIKKRLNNEFKEVQEIQNKQYLFCFFQGLSLKKNLLEFEVMLYIKEYGFVLLADVIVKNPNLTKLKVRCMNSKLMNHEEGSAKDNMLELNQLEYTFATYNGLGEKIKDEIFIFFNYLMTLVNLKVFQLTHFWFNSDLNFMSCELAKENRNLKELSLAYNQAVINNDEALLDSFSFVSTDLVKLDMGISYFHMIRRFDYLIGPSLLELNCGVLDFVSVICLMKYVKNTNLRRLKCTLNKPCDFDAIDLIMQQIANHIITSNTLRRFEINNMYYISDNNKDKHHIEIIKSAIIKYILKKLNSNKVLRPLILNENTSQSLHTIIRSFYYIPEKSHTKCV